MTDPVASEVIIEGMNAGSPGAGPSDPDADKKAATITSEQGQINGQGGGAPLNALPQTVTTLAREYVWGPGDGPGGVDELLVQYAGSDRAKPWWVLQDGGGDIAALVEIPSPGAQAVVAGQWTYDAYGSCLTADVLRPHPLMHSGHKALFFDRLDVGVVASSGDELPRLIPYAHAVYQMRNRAYAPALGRFYQRDPNATALALIEATAYHGRGLDAIVSAFSMEDMYGDGANLYQYLGSNPWRSHDYLGLSQDPFEMVDEYIASDMGSKRVFLEGIAGGAHVVAYISAYIASYLPFPVASLAGGAGLAMMDEPEALSNNAYWQFGKSVIEFSPLQHLLGLVRSEAVQTALMHGSLPMNITGGVSGGVMSYRSAEFQSWLKQGVMKRVYIGLNHLDEIVYVGETNDPPRRFTEHGDRFKPQLIRDLGPMTEHEAWCVENYVMSRYGRLHKGGRLQNIRFSVAVRSGNKFYASLAEGARILQKCLPHSL